MIKTTKQNKTRGGGALTRATCHTTTHKHLPLESQHPYYHTRVVDLKHGFHNVSRWMTWLPISLKNAAKCDKWYQLQNHSITESLNANCAREKPSTAIPVHAASLSVEQKPNLTKEPWLVSFLLSHAAGGRPSGYPESTVKPSVHG